MFGLLLPAAATTTAATAARTAVATAATTAAARTFLGFIHTKRTTAHVFAVESLDCTSRIGTRHFHEAEAARTAGFAIVDQRHRFNGAMSSEHFTHLVFVSRKRQVAYIDLCHIE
jgi:hypothetical protein